MFFQGDNAEKAYFYNFKRNWILTHLLSSSLRMKNANYITFYYILQTPKSQVLLALLRSFNILKQVVTRAIEIAIIVR